MPQRTSPGISGVISGGDDDGAAPGPQSPEEADSDAIGRWDDDGGAPAPPSLNDASSYADDGDGVPNEASASGTEAFDGTFEGDIAGGLGVIRAAGAAYQLYQDLNAMANAPPGQTAGVVADKAASWAGALAGAELGGEIGTFFGGPTGNGDR